MESTPDRISRPGGSTSEQNELLSKIDSLISTRLNTLEEKLSSTQMNVAEAVLGVPSYTFKRKSCEDQFRFNCQVEGKLKGAEQALQTGKAEGVADNLAQGMALIRNRQKIIKLADSSELGWSVAKEYQAHPLASDSEDEKKMLRAEARANRKMKKVRRFRPYNAYSPGQQTSNTGTAIQPVIGQGRKPGLCFECGRPGHWKAECRQNKEKTGDKISDIPLYLLRVNDHFDSRNVTKNSKLSVFPSDNNFSQNESESPRGRLRNCISVWNDIGASEYILNLIQNGYKLPFKKLPESLSTRNNLSSRKNSEFVKEEINRLLALNCISIVDKKPYIVNPLTVAHGKSGKLRLVLDCRLINPYLVIFKFQYEDMSTAKELFHSSEYLFTFDLKSAYHIVEIHPEHRTYLGFRWPDSDGKETFYVYNVLPFGISTAAHIFTKLMKIPIAYLRGQGNKVVMFLDDGLGGESDILKACDSSKVVRYFLLNLGFLIAENKCKWEPSQTAVWLGHEWNMVGNTVRVTQERIKRVIASLRSFFFELENNKLQIIRVRFLASLVGQIISLRHSVGNLVFSKTRFCYKCIDTRLSWESYVYIKKEAVDELKFWAENVESLNVKGNDIKKVVSCGLNCFTDASATGYGGYVALCAGALVEGSEVCGSWTENEKSMSSTWRELTSVERVLRSNEQVIKENTIGLYCDNSNVSKILKRGSKSSNLHEIHCQISSYCCGINTSLEPHWISRKGNILADKMSRTVDNDDWEISNSVFEYLNGKWGPYTIDRFASNLTAKCGRFNSKWWFPGCESIDALSQSWSVDTNWWVPPPKLISRVVNKFIAEQANGTLIAPLWKSAPFWPLICESENTFRPFVSEHINLGRVDVVSKRSISRGIFAEDPLKFDLVAFKIKHRQNGAGYSIK